MYCTLTLWKLVKNLDNHWFRLKKKLVFSIIKVHKNLISKYPIGLIIENSEY